MRYDAAPVESNPPRGMTLAASGKAPYFDPKAISSNRLYRDIGRSAERPFMIFATLLDTSLGDLLCKVAFLSTLKDQFDHARLIVRYRDLRSYSGDVVSLSPNIDHAMPLKGERPKWLGRYFPDMRPWLPLGRWTLGRAGMREAFHDFVVIESMMNARSLHGFEQPTVMRVPPGREAALHGQLLGLGLDPERWYAAVHYRAGTYGPKRGKSPIRSGNPESYRQLVDYIIDDLGGQVVQLGHPELDAFPARPGFVDLSRLADTFLLQAYAVCHSRFLVAGPSGPVALGWGFQVPTMVVDATDGHGGWGEAVQAILTHEVTTPAGSVLRNRELFEAGLLDKPLLYRKIKNGEAYRLRNNNGEELAAAARFLFDRTTDVTGWRPVYRRSAASRPNHFVWPPQTRENLRFLGE